MASYLVFLSEAPLSNIAAEENLNLCLTLASLDNEVNLIVKDDGIKQILPFAGQLIGRADFAGEYKALSYYGIDNIFVVEGDSNLPEYIKRINSLELQEKLNTADVVLTF